MDMEFYPVKIYRWVFSLKPVPLWLKIQTGSSLKSASLLVRAAVNGLLMILITILSNVGTSRLDVRGVIIYVTMLGNRVCYNGREIRGAVSKCGIYKLICSAR